MSFRDGREIETSPIPGKISGFSLLPGDVVRMYTAGGGGYGDPLERDATLVAEDVRLGYTRADDASEIYGVDITADGKVDEAKTRERRSKLSREHATVIIGASKQDEYAGARRLFVVAEALATKLAVNDGALCELINPRGPNLRGWIRIDSRASSMEMPVGPFGRAILRWNAGDAFQLRSIKRAGS